MKRTREILVGALGVSLLATVFCVWSALGNDVNICVTAGCALYQDFSLGGFSLWWVGVAVFALLAALALLGAGTVPADMSLWNLMIGNCGGVLGETCKLAIIAGGLYMLVRGIIDWRIPVTFIGTVFVCYLLKDGAQMAVYQIFAGGLMLGAFFMATDYATSPVTGIGKIIFGVGCGILLFVIRAFASYPEGCSFAILFMNVVTPMIDKFTTPKPFGEVKTHA